MYFRVTHHVMSNPKIHTLSLYNAAAAHGVTWCVAGSERPGRGAGMGGGNFRSFTSGRRTAFSQGKRVSRDHEDVWDKNRGWKKNHFQTR